MSKAYDEFSKKAVEILPKHANNETISRVAFHLMQSELEYELKILKEEHEKKMLKMENEKKITMEKSEQSELEHGRKTSRVASHLMQLELEHESKMKILIMEMERKQEKKEMEMDMEWKLKLQKEKQDQLMAFHSKQLSAVVQRLVVLYVCTHHKSVRSSVFSPLTPTGHRFFAPSVFCIHTDKSTRAF